jgi:hypothetical protein
MARDFEEALDLAEQHPPMIARDINTIDTLHHIIRLD